MSALPSKLLETFANPSLERDYTSTWKSPSYMSVPQDRPARFCYVDPRLHRGYDLRRTESLKLYIWSFRNEGHFHEDVTNRILDDLVAAIQPRFMRLTAKFYVRGGIFTNIVTEHRKPGWQAQPLVDLMQFETQSNTRG